MKTVLITAFEPYDRWGTNASWDALVALTSQLPERPRVVTRRYPVDFEKTRAKLAEDLAANYDYVLHLGQAPGSSRIHLEAVGINVAGHSQQSPDDFQPLVVDGPAAYRTALPLGQWSAKIREAGIPVQVSYHAGTYLCNAILYLCHHFAAQQQLNSQAAFIHLPLTPAQTLHERHDVPSLPTSMCVEAIRLILNELESSSGVV
ncbi:Pyrrolidone-carboxylate peptidase [Anatilimnocola aggregata]|uniref:Pyrrolidone-carboxylate peptidase n=1 Tax=Anatilimnocola aggregata TaxID=2528021 RepID=A0A517YBJ1_9BACT|nr:pyroglutamyl-peptidase I [Anatilimnocola aggregata]QDU27608.1 Pyrrolidone-carboxylate peptidase [Anatilimnocola aggregata]